MWHTCTPQGAARAGGTAQPQPGTPQHPSPSKQHQGKEQHQPSPRAEPPLPRAAKPFWAQGITGRDWATLAQKISMPQGRGHRLKAGRKAAELFRGWSTSRSPASTANVQGNSATPSATSHHSYPLLLSLRSPSSLGQLCSPAPDWHLLKHDISPKCLSRIPFLSQRSERLKDPPPA